MPEKISEKSRGVALALCVPLGWVGAHRFYTGKIGTGILQLCTFGGFGIWWLIDAITIAAGTFRDVDGYRVWEWAEPDPRLGRGRESPQTQEQLDAMMEAMYAMRDSINDLSNRVDFMERVLERSRENREIGPGQD